MLKKASQREQLLPNKPQTTKQTKNTNKKTIAPKPRVLFYSTTTTKEKKKMFTQLEKFWI
jgi:hypothetical protein